ncbi:DEAD/DEAH box helicase [Roseibium sp. RKSG952]|uniref:DEAD/DEAH box helicase n=1 Tax=Roseibium sp. RKSG952 TaxID=2529384 RepID=UPI0012BD0A1A|nr:DEAD/DEAH box helicase [Roseibium sp. RKSG952]MTH96662.1 DEAD/DEAH box helicase [Roseibium sp. RKSG952]
MAITLRPYQSEAISAVHDYWATEGGNPLIVLPTGAGKSLVIAELVRGLREAYPAMRIGMITHVKELIQQNAEELIKLWPEAQTLIGIYSAGLGQRNLHRPITFMGIQSVHKKAAALGGFDLLLIDEAHLIPRNTATMYGRFISDCLTINASMPVCGLTATPYRLDSGRLDRGEDRLFDKIVYDANVRDLIEDGYLANLISKATVARIDTSKVHIRGGEFKADELEAAALDVVEAAVAEIVTMGEDRAGWLAFCTGVDHAVQVRDLIRQAGYSCEAVTGETPKGERDRILTAYKARQIRCLTSVGVLTTGFNAPHVDLIAMLRPTLSTSLFIQCIGRGLRKAPGKGNCLVLDFAGNTVRHGPVDAVKPKKEPGGGDLPDEEKVKPDTERAKECPDCAEVVGLATRICPGCGHEWPFAEKPRHEAEAASDAPILSTEQVAPQWLAVTDTRFEIHQKFSAPDSLKITYATDKRDYSEWLCFEHGGRAAGKAGMIWRRLGGALPIPQTTQEAVSRKGELDTVVAVSVKRQAPGSKYWTVADRQTANGQAMEAAE